MPAILPGVEFSVGGERPIHFLVIFAADTDPDEIDRAIAYVFRANDRFDPRSGTPRAIDKRKRMARLLIEDVTLTRATRSLGVRLRGGATYQLAWAAVPPIHELYKTKDEVVAEIDRLLNDHTDGEAATILNGHGYRTGHGFVFTSKLVKSIRWKYAIKSHYMRLRERGLLTACEMADRLAVSRQTIDRWHKQGRLRTHAYNDEGFRLYEIPEHPPTKHQRRKRQRTHEYATNRTMEVQYEA